MKLIHSFEDKSLENSYQEKISEKNKLPAKGLLVFNIIFHMFFLIFSIINFEEDLLILSFCNMAFIVLVFLIYICTKKYKRKFLILLVYGSILIPLTFLIQFLKSIFGLNESFHDLFDLLMVGFCLEMYVAQVYLFELSWIEIALVKILARMFVIFSHHLDENEFRFHFPDILLITLTFASLIFDFQNEKNVRKNFFQEYLIEQHFDSFKQILENMTDEILVYQKGSIVFANKASFQFFKTQNLDEIYASFNLNFTIHNNDIKHLEERNIFLSKNECFWDKIKTFFNLNNESCHFNGDYINNLEFDINVKKIYWKNDISLLILLSKVNEKNVKARLELVNSFLTFVLGNISHEINTPLHIAQGKLENLNFDKETNKNEIKVIKNFLIILNSMTEIMVDLFRVRKGELYFNVNKINANLAFNKILSIFKICFPYKNVTIFLKNIPNFIYTDSNRFNNILIFILGKFIQRLENGKIEISCIAEKILDLQFYRINILCEGIIKPCEIMLSSQIKAKNLKLNSPFGTSNQEETNSDFSLINTLINSISCGNSSKLEIIERKDEIFSSFLILNCESDLHQSIKLNDPFQKNQHYVLHLIISNEKLQQNSSDVINISNVSLKIPDFPIVGENEMKIFRILNVDDMLFSLMIISNYCHTSNLLVTEAKNGLEAYQEVQKLFDEEKKVFDIIFMDIDMPIMNGFDSAKKIGEFLEEKKVSKKSIVLAVTANTNNEEMIKNCKSSGIQEVLKKPLSMKKFEKTIKKYLE